MSVPDAQTILPPPEIDVLVGLATFPAAESLTVGKDGFNPHFQYAYMTEAALFAAARAALAAAGLSATITFEQGQHETITTFNKDGEERPAIMATVAARLVIRDKTGVAVECLAYGQGIDPADKAYAKAMSMASKYVVQKALMIGVEADDTDAGESQSVASRRGGNGRTSGGGPASGKQLDYLVSLVKKVHLVPTGSSKETAEAMGLRLVTMNGMTAPAFVEISKAAASDLIERLKAVEDRPEAGEVILERLASWEAENGVPTAEPFAGQPDEPVAATTTDEEPPY